MAENVSSLSADRIAYLEGLVSRGKTAAAVFTQFSQREVDAIVKAMVLAGLDQAQYLARLIPGAKLTLYQIGRAHV